MKLKIGGTGQEFTKEEVLAAMRVLRALWLNLRDEPGGNRSSCFSGGNESQVAYNAYQIVARDLVEANKATPEFLQAFKELVGF